MKAVHPPEEVYLYSMGKRLRLTAIFDNDDDANAHMEKSNDAVVACFGPFILCADKYDQGQKP